MRLLNVRTFEIQDFGIPIPDYAIVTHRWTGKEVTLQQWQQYLSTSFPDPDYESGDGLSKIINSCSLAQEQGIHWIWLDTCCIDKTNNVELGEAINSMYSWYQRAKVCYAYLSDVDWYEPQPEIDNQDDNDAREARGLAAREAFIHSNWFTRGWTLQELLAPGEVQFYDRSWNFVGTKLTLAPAIAAASKIDPSYLTQGTPISRASLATRMSWASERVTTRDEDTAYCLLGLLDVNLDLRYGEGRRAFLRLQKLLVETSPDESVLAWTSPGVSRYGLLAPWVDCFRDSGDITVEGRGKAIERKPYHMTNQGLEFHIPNAYLGITWYGHGFLGATKRSKSLDVALNCWRVGPVTERLRTVSLRLRNSEGLWQRVDCGHLMLGGTPYRSTDYLGNDKTVSVIVPQP